MKCRILQRLYCKVLHCSNLLESNCWISTTSQINSKICRKVFTEVGVLNSQNLSSSLEIRRSPHELQFSSHPSFWFTKKIRTQTCDKSCPCVCNTSLSLVSNMKQMQSGDANADLVCVIDEEGSEKIKIVMKIYGSERTVVRQRDETLDKSLERIKINIKNANAKLSKKLRKKAKKEQQMSNIEETETLPEISLFDSHGEKIDEMNLNILEGWKKGSMLKVCDMTYRVVINPPKIENIQIVQRPIVGFTIYPQLEMTFADLKYSRFDWFRRFHKSPEHDTDEDGAMETNETLSGKHPRESDAESSICEEDVMTDWEHVGEEQTYTPTTNDLGYEIRLKVTPGNERFPVDVKTNFGNDNEACYVTTCNAVMDVKEKFLFEDRIKLTNETCKGNRFRIVSYNILADVYASTEYAQDFLFPYCPANYMDINYRQQLVIKEICGYNSDIICLQEVDRSIFKSYYMPVMSVQGYAGALASKDGIKEGVALFYRTERFKMNMVDNIILRDVLNEERNRDLLDKISTNSSFLKTFRSKPTCLLVAVLESKDNSRRLLIGNTHLYWHPRGCHIRLIQMELILREMRRLYEKHSKESDSELSCVLLGDLNSHPHSAVVQLITKGNVPANHSDWFSMGKAEFLRDMSLSNSVLFTSASGFPPYTTLVTSFQGCLDYVFVDKSLKVHKVIPQPENEEIVKHCALPNISTPSDHIAQVVEVGWTPG